MKLVPHAKHLLSAVIAMFCLTGALFADGLDNNEIEFTGRISSVAANGQGLGTLFVQVRDFDLRVVVNSKTELLDPDGKEITMSEFIADMNVEIAGKYSSSGILASRIRQLGNLNGASKDAFIVRGHITAIQASGEDQLISLLGITIVVQPKSTKIMDDGVEATPASLKTGMEVQIAGKILGSKWTADSIEILSPEAGKNKVRFEGIVTQKSDSSIKVAVQGLPDNVTTVLINSNTLITGDLAKDSYVLVIGTLNAELNTIATEIRVLQALEIKPDERKLKVNESAIFTVKLRLTAAADVTVSLKSSDTSVLELPKASVVIPKGSSVADFSANAKKIGSSEITAATAPGQEAKALVTVGLVSEDENERPAGETRLAFAPDKIKLEPNASRDVVLLVKPPQPAPVTVGFSNYKLVDVAATPLGGGAAELKVTIKAGSKEGTDSVTATLPSALGGGKAELLVEISSKGGGPGNQEQAEIAFRPDKIKVPIGETRSVNLMLSRPLDVELVITLSSGPDKIIEVPKTVTIPAGTKSIKVDVKGTSAGTAKVTAIYGGDIAELEVEVRTN